MSEKYLMLATGQALRLQRGYHIAVTSATGPPALVNTLIYQYKAPFPWVTRLKDQYAQDKYNIFDHHCAWKVTKGKANIEGPVVLLMKIMWVYAWNRMCSTSKQKWLKRDTTQEIECSHLTSMWDENWNCFHLKFQLIKTIGILK